MHRPSRSIAIFATPKSPSAVTRQYTYIVHVSACGKQVWRIVSAEGKSWAYPPMWTMVREAGTKSFSPM
jgi:hypothetical protein